MTEWLLTLYVIDCSLKLNRGSRVVLPGDPSHYLPAHSRDISFEFWVQPEKSTRHSFNKGHHPSYLLGTGIVRGSWAWELRLQSSFTGLSFESDYWSFNDNGASSWSLQSFTSKPIAGETTRYIQVYSILTLPLVLSNNWAHISFIPGKNNSLCINTLNTLHSCYILFALTWPRYQFCSSGITPSTSNTQESELALSKVPNRRWVPRVLGWA